MPTPVLHYSTAPLTERLIKLCHLAGDAIMAIYQHPDGFDVDIKTDCSPVTAADIAAHKILLAGLRDLLPNTPVLSEEGAIPHWQERRRWSRYWLIDPLDGTKEFISRNGDFSVNVALIEHNKPVLGVVYAPTHALTYAGNNEQGAWKISGVGQTQRSEKIHTRPLQPSHMAIVASRRYGKDALQALLNHLLSTYPAIAVESVGSSLKLCMVAEGLADLYPRLSPTCEWDTAAGQAIVEAAGGLVLNAKLQPLRYNQQESVLNDDFYVVGDTSAHWAKLLNLPDR